MRRRPKNGARRGVDGAFYAVLSRRLEDIEESRQICLMCEERVVDAPGHGADGGFVQDEVAIFRSRDHRLSIADIFAKEVETRRRIVGFGICGVDIFAFPRQKVVDPDDVVARFECMREEV